MNRHLSSLLLTLFLAVPLLLAQAVNIAELGGRSSDSSDNLRKNLLRLLRLCDVPVSPACENALGDDAPVQPGPVRLDANLGQSDPGYPFLARGRGHFLFLNGVETAVDLRDSRGVSQAVVRMRLENARPSPGDGIGPLPHRLNYFIGKRHTTNVPVFDQVKFAEVYPGLDLAFYPSEGGFEHDVIVRPGADPSRIRLRFDGADTVVLNADGELERRSGKAEVRWKRPRVYQESQGRRTPVEGRYELLGANRAGFKLGAYDRTGPLTIDPVISYLTYLGQAASSVAGRSAVDAAGNMYLTGATGDGT